MTLAEEIEVLALSMRDPLPTLAEARDVLGDYPRDRATRALDRDLRRHEPRQRFLEARKDRRYDQTRRVVNGVLVPVGSAAQGQLSSLFSLPFEAADYLVVGHRFLTPEERKELFLARLLAAGFPPSDPAAGRATGVARSKADNLVLTQAMQARENGRRALSRGCPQTAIFWYERERELRSFDEIRRSGHEDALAGVTRDNTGRRDSLLVSDGDSSFFSTAEFGIYTDATRAFFTGDQEGFDAMARRMDVEFPSSSSRDDIVAARAALARRSGQDALARVALDELAVAAPGDGWAPRAAAALELPVYTPAATLGEARRRDNRVFRAYLLRGEDPTAADRAWTAEEARTSRASWVSQARGLFVSDALARTMFLPFTPPTPRTHLLNAAATVDDAWFDSDEGRDWLLRVARAQAIANRHFRAAEMARRAGEPGKALSYERKAARHLEKLGDDAPRPRDQVAIYTRLLNAWPAYARRERVEEKLAEARVLAGTIGTVTPDELRAWPELWKEAGLFLNPDLLDGRKSNGEVSKEGVSLLSHGAYTYKDRDGDRRIEVAMDMKEFRQVVAQLEPRRRGSEVRAEVHKPLARRKVPLALEAGAFPGFDLSPSLVPLDPDVDQRRLYE